MAGGELQLFAIGKQNILLNSEPQITYFNAVYKRHTHFSIENVRQRFQEDANFGKILTSIISKKGDLLGSVYLHLTLPALTIPPGSTYIGWTNSLGHAIIEYVEFKIGGLVIDKQYGMWMEIWNELTLSSDKTAGVNLAIGKFDLLTQLQTNATSETSYTIPLNFWFTKNPGLFLPLIALKNHSIKISVKLRNFQECITYDGVTPPDNVDLIEGSFLVDYIYLSEEERNRMKRKKHMYLIDQVQFLEKDTIPANSTIHRTSLNDFNHAIKEINWVFVETASETNNDWFNFARRSDTQKLITNVQLKFENLDRFEKRSEDYFRLIQNLQYHTTIPIKYIYTYSFGLFPERKVPSGTNNFSKYDNIDIHFDMNSSNPEIHMYMFASNWNFLIIKNGMGAVAYND